jgi:hypothetical protein
MAMFILTRPDCARIVEEFEAVYDPPPSSTAHREEGHSLQVKFCKDVLSFVDVVVHIGNPFIPTRQELVALDTQNVMEQVVVTSRSQIHAMGQVLQTAYVTERLKKLQYRYPIPSIGTTCSPSPTDLTAREKARRTIAHRSRT